jgi:hypothetical protein
MAKSPGGKFDWPKAVEPKSDTYVYRRALPRAVD